MQLKTISGLISEIILSLSLFVRLQSWPALDIFQFFSSGLIRLMLCVIFWIASSLEHIWLCFPVIKLFFPGGYERRSTSMCFVRAALTGKSFLHFDNTTAHAGAFTLFSWCTSFF